MGNSHSHAGGPGIHDLGGLRPDLHPDSWVAPGAIVVGDVRIGARSSVWYNCVLRGDVNRIVIGRGSNIQDGTIIHVDPGPFQVEIGDGVTVGHRCIIHGCRIEDEALIGMGAIVLNGAQILQGAMLGAGAVLSGGKTVGENELWLGAPARFHRQLKPEERDELRHLVENYVANARHHEAHVGAAGQRAERSID